MRDGHVHSQEELQAQLAQRGYAVAQPTLSRDLRDLAVAKTASGYVLMGADVTPPADRLEDRLDRALREFVLTVDVAATIVVIRTPPAAAHTVARAIDETGLIPGIAGTIAGDDTIFLAARSPADAAHAAERLLAPLGPRSTAARRQPVR